MAETLYIESSAFLALLLGEKNAKEVERELEQSEQIVSSALTLLETHRALMRARAPSAISHAEHAKLVGFVEDVTRDWGIKEMERDIQARTIQAFPSEPVRTLDAIHLATILYFVGLYRNLKVLSFDERLKTNLVSLGVMS